MDKTPLGAGQGGGKEGANRAVSQPTDAPTTSRKRMRASVSSWEAEITGLLV